uniref:Bacteriophage protein gp37 n=1 Tax=Desulfovibrio sp. U5L TaxID=596152 RepID=I2Q2Q7_9BACT
MAQQSKIEWCDATWNPVVGCSPVSPGCDHCYAARMAHRLGANPATPQFTGLTGVDQKWTGETRFVQGALNLPLTWRKPRRIFVCSMGDLFHESVPFAWVDQVFAVMALAPQHTFMVLTKRPERMRQFCAMGRYGILRQVLHEIGAPNINPGWPLPNVWLGVTIENQEQAVARVPILLETPGAKRFVSVEPMLGQVRLRCLSVPDAFLDPFGDRWCTTWDALDGTRGTSPFGRNDPFTGPKGSHLDWVICGGETGPGARPTNPEWVRSLRDQCVKACDVPFFFKQWGEWAPSDNFPSNTPFKHWKEFLRGVDEPKRLALRGWDYDANAKKFGEKVAYGPFTLVVKAGKHRAGRLLDSEEWTYFPGDTYVPF